MRSPVQSWVALQERRAQLFTQLGFLFSAGVSLLTARRKQKRPRQSLEGSSLLGCFADLYRITDQREVILDGYSDAAIRSSMVDSLLRSCNATGINPSEWLEDILTKVYSYTKENRNLEELLPHLWKK